MSLPRIAIDAMGGDEGVRVMVEGAALARRNHDSFKFLLVGDGKRIEVLGGLKAGMPYASTGSFVVKSELGKGSAEHTH